MNKNLFQSYLQILSHDRWRAVFLIALGTVAGLLEGVALMCLIPLFNVGMRQADSATSFLEVFHLAWNPASRSTMLIFMLSAFVALGLLSAVARAGTEVGVLRLRTAIELRFRKILSTALLHMSWPSFTSMKVGEIGKSITQEGYMVGLGAEAAIQMVTLSGISLCFLILAFGLSPKMTVITLCFGMITVLLSRLISADTRRQAAAYTESSTRLANRVEEFFSNLKFVKSFGLVSYVERVLALEQEQSANRFFHTYLFQPVGRLVFEVLGILFIGGIVAFAFWVVPSAFGRIIIFLTIFYRLAPRLMSLQHYYGQAQSLEPWYSMWCKRHATAMENQEAVLSTQGAILSEFHDVRLENVGFRYESRVILRNVELSLPRGKALALVGESGGGKTTILDLVTGLLSPQEGRCLVNGTPLESLSLEAWRRRIGIVMQNSPIFHTTALMNIALADPNPDRAKAETCAKQAHAWEFIERLPRQLDCDLGEKGASLSQGECQRLALARALYRDPWLLILDEATSALDAQSEAYILESLRALKGSRTILMVSHRLNTVDFADEILLLSGGEIVERGSYRELMGKLSSDFRKLAKLQGIVES